MGEMQEERGLVHRGPRFTFLFIGMAATLKPAEDHPVPVCQGLKKIHEHVIGHGGGHGLFQGQRIPVWGAENDSALWLSKFAQQFCLCTGMEGKQICVNSLQPTLAVALHLLLLSRQEIRNIQQIKNKQHNQERMFWLLLPLAFLEHIKPAIVNLPKAVLFLIHTDGKSMYTQI